ncbi:MAG: hypothetical protein LBT68_04445 [Spirochaetales bacterium]|nr:hypothetical protein [Spirochaetales bacterium]
MEKLVERSRTAQKIIAEYSQERIDAIVKTLAKVVFDNADPLAKMATKETGMGVYEDKITKGRRD